MPSKFYFTAALDRDAQVRPVYGPFSSSKEAHEAAEPYLSEGLDVVVHRDEPVCDFCSEPGIAASYSVPDFEMHVFTGEELEGWGSRGDWGACQTCHEFIQARDKDGLLNRSLHFFFIAHPDVPDNPRIRHGVGEMIGGLHLAFFNLVEGQTDKPRNG